MYKKIKTLFELDILHKNWNNTVLDTLSKHVYDVLCFHSTDDFCIIDIFNWPKINVFKQQKTLTEIIIIIIIIMIIIIKRRGEEEMVGASS